MGSAFAPRKDSPPLKSRKSPGCSSRYLLDGEDDDEILFGSVEDLVPQLTRIKSSRFQIVTGEDSAVLKPSPFSAPRADILHGASASSFSSLPSNLSKNPKAEENDDEDVIKSSSLEDFFRSSSSSSEKKIISPVVLADSSSSRAQEQVRNFC